MKEEYPRIQEMAKKIMAEIYFEDEAGIRSDFHAGTIPGDLGSNSNCNYNGHTIRIEYDFCCKPTWTDEIMEALRSSSRKSRQSGFPSAPGEA